MKKKSLVQGHNTRTSLKQKFTAYRAAVSNYIYSLQNPAHTLAFSVKGYEVTPTGKKPNALSAPELLAIVNTANKLDKRVELRTSGVGDGGQLDFSFVDISAGVPAEMRGY
jgi:hypothetical protein